MLVSVVIPAYNREKTIGEAIRSVQEQSCTSFEIIVVDDASKDGTVSAVNALAKTDNRIKLICLPKNQGAQAARKEGVRQASGEWIAFLDSDDRFLTDSLEKRLSCAKENSASIVYSDVLLLRKDEELKAFGTLAVDGINSYKNLLSSPAPMFPSLLIRSTIAKMDGIIDEEIKSWQEWDTSINLARHAEFAFLPEPTFIYDCRGTDTISGDIMRSARGYEAIVRKHSSEIVRNAGIDTLEHHYKKLISLYHDAGADLEAERCRSYAVRLMEESSQQEDKQLKTSKISDLAETYRNSSLYSASFIYRHVACAWSVLSAIYPRIALFGAGQHSRWILEIITIHNMIKPVLVIDEKLQQSELCGIEVCSPENAAQKDIDCIVLSSDVWQKKMRKSCNKWKIPLIDLYETFMPGPYAKEVINLEVPEKQYRSALMEDHIKSIWKQILNPEKRLCLFGAGSHTEWLLNILSRQGLKLPDLIFDENSNLKEISGIPILTPSEDLAKNAIIVLSTDLWQNKFRARCAEKTSSVAAAIDLYSYFPSGPYLKISHCKNAPELEKHLGFSASHISPLASGTTEKTFFKGRALTNEDKKLLSSKGYSPDDIEKIGIDDLKTVKSFVGNCQDSPYADLLDSEAGNYCASASWKSFKKEPFHHFSTLLSGELHTFCPRCGKHVTSRDSFPVYDFAYDNPVFYRFNCCGIFYLIYGLCPSDILGLYDPESGIVISYRHQNYFRWCDLAYTEECFNRWISSFKNLCLKHSAIVKEYMDSNERLMVHPLGITANFGHYLCNELVGLFKLAEKSASRKMHVMEGPYSKFPTNKILDQIITDCKIQGSDEAFRKSISGKFFLVTLGSYEPIQEKLAQSIIKFAEAQITKDFKDAFSKFQQNGKEIILITLRTHNRRWLEQEEGTIRIIKELQKSSSFSFVFDGAPEVAELVTRIQQACPDAYIFDASGSNLYENIYINSKISYFIGPFGQNTAISSLINKPGVVYGHHEFIMNWGESNERYMANYRENPVYSRLVTGDCPEETDVDTGLRNMHIDWQEIYKNLCSLQLEHKDT